MARRTKEDALETRRQILLTALRLFSERGVAKTSFEDIAHALHLTKGAVYWHFETKNVLLVDLIRAAHAETVKVLGTLVPGTGWNGIRDYFINWSNYIVSDEQARQYFFLFSFQVEWSGELMESLRDAFWKEGGTPFYQLRACITALAEKGLVRAGVSVDELTSLLVALWHGTAKCQIINNLKFNLAETVGKGFDAVAASYLVKEQHT